MKKVYLFLVMCCLSAAVYAQTAASYGLTATTGTFTTISGTGTAISAGGMISDNGVTISIPIGFNFSYCGTNYSTASASANGWFSLVNSAATPANVNGTGSLAAIGSGVGLLMPYWFDLSGVGQTAYFQTTGTVGSRIFVMEWKNWGVSGATAALNFQIKLYEGTNTVEFWYGFNSGSVPTTATVGIGNSTSDFQTLPLGTSTFSNTSFNATCTPPANGTVLRWCAPAPAISGGTTAFCAGTTTTLTNTLAGGTWSSGAPATATVNASTGVVTGVSAGTVTISYTPACGPAATKVVTVTPTPTTFTVTGGGGYCAGSSGVLIGLDGSTSPVSYQLFNGINPVGAPVTGTGAAFTFPLQTASGTYTVIGTSAASCSSTMLGTAVVTVNPLPTAFSVTGGGPYCTGTSGAAVGLSSSTIGVNYQLFFGATPVGASQVGTGFAISFGPQASTGSNYTVVGTNATTACAQAMSGFVTVSTLALPTSFSLTGGGPYCLGGTGVPIGLSNSTTGVNYQLQLAGVGVSTLAGTTGSVLNFGLQTAPGVYAIVATNPTTTCTNPMSGTTTVTINALPIAYTVTGGGAYCAGGTGMVVGLGNSTVGVNYQLFNGITAVGAPVAGSGTAISFGLQTTVGSYTVVGTNATTGCVNNMFSSVSISTLPLPTPFTITGGGGYCAGGAGVPVGLGSSTVGTNYLLYNVTTLIGAALGTGLPISFGSETAAGAYSVVATTTATGCQNNMSGTTTVTINALPAAFNVLEVGTGSYCAGSTGVTIQLSNSVAGINYQLFNGSTVVGSPVGGLPGLISFGAQTAAGSYTVMATNATTTCTANMTGSQVVTINPLPTIYTLTGASGFCGGGGTTLLGLSASNSGIGYQLLSSGSPVGIAVPGGGGAISFGAQPAGTYTAMATNSTTACSVNMSGSITVTTNALPSAATVTVAGGGSTNICAGTTALINIGSSTTGINYQLYNGSTLVGLPVAGTGGAFNFPAVSAAGTYSVTATNTTTGCSSAMPGTPVVNVIALPTVFAINGGGPFCSGTGGSPIGLSSSALLTNYQLWNSSGFTGISIAGTGLPISFGSITTAGTYSAVAVTSAGSCTNAMSGTVNVSVNPLPAPFTISGSGSYCAGGPGLDIRLLGSALGYNYQLMNGSTLEGAPRAGTGVAIDFGNQTAGTYTIVSTNISTGCFVTMTGSAPVVATPLPAIDTITGGGSYCPGTGGMAIGLNSSTSGITYKLYSDGVFVDSVAGVTPLSISFGAQTAPGIYTVVAGNPANGCIANMAGSATIGIYPLPVVYNMNGGGNFCSGGTGVNVGLSGSNTGVSYQLMLDNSAVAGAVMTGTGLGISFGAQTDSGTYTVVATSASGCTNTMHGVSHVGINGLPTLYSVTGGGNYCVGGTGSHVTLSGSDAGTDYQLVIGGSTPVGVLVPGTGSTLDFGPQTGIGTFTVMATNVANTCTTTMSSSVAIDTNSLPAVYNVTGGGSYCAGSAGLAVTLSGSDATATYALYRDGSAVGSPVTGVGGGSYSFGPETAAGTYSIKATNIANSCSATMSGTVNVSINPLPVKYIVSGGGNYCSGASGVTVSLSGSNSGISYQLYVGGTGAGASMAGTSMALNFTHVTAAGLGQIVANNVTTGCSDTMNSSVNVGINPLPAVHTVVSTSSSYCSGGAGVPVYIDGSDVGINYQLYNGTTVVGLPMAGTGDSINFGNLTSSGSYEIVAINPLTGCTKNMAPGVTVTIFPLPTVFAVTGGGQYCAGGAGVHIGLGGSNIGISYQLYLTGVPTGDSVAGTGGAIDFGLHTTAGTYQVVATNHTTTCTNMMSGSAIVSINALPLPYPVTGTGSFCFDGAGLPVGISHSQLGITYQLMLGTTPIATVMSGTGSAITFGPQTSGGTYTIVGTSVINGCSSTMTGAAIITVNPLPASYSITGGGNFCPGGTGVNVGLSGSHTGVTYKLYNGSAMMGSWVGTGSALNFGLETTAGSYTVVASDNITGCPANMSGAATVVVDPLPGLFTMVGGGNYCAGGTGVDLGLGGSVAGINYTLYDGFTTIATLPGTGGPVDFGMQTLGGTYTVLATNGATGCTNTMTGTGVIVVNPIVTPSVNITNSTGSDTVCSGRFITFTANPVSGGLAPTYAWTINGAPASSGGATYAYAPSNGDRVTVTMTSDAVCATPPVVSGSVVMTVDLQGTPTVAVSADPGTEVCQGMSVTFTPTPSFGGSTPTYQWFVNGGARITAPTYSYIPAVGDHIYAIMTSNYLCRLAPQGVSPTVDLTVDLPTLPVVTIATNPGQNIAVGETVTFTATAVNGGGLPTYQWVVNNIPQGGATSNTFTSSSIANNDSVTCQVTSSGACSGMTGFNSVTMHVANVGVKPITLAGGNIILVPNPNNGTFTVKGNLGTATDEEVTLQVVNMLGQVIYAQKAAAQYGEINEQVRLNGSLANGMYILNVTSPEGNQVFHFVIEQ